MQSALSSAVSGLEAMQKALDVVGGNLANVNTPGFKANVITFKEAIASVLKQPSGPGAAIGSVNPQQLGEGVGIGQMNARYTQGSLEVTGRATDMAITGDGFFVIKQMDGTNAFGRNGNFSLDRDGALVTSDGLFVQGWQAVEGEIDTTTDVGNLTIPLGRLTLAAATENMSFNGNLDATTTDTVATTTTSVSGTLEADQAGATGTVNATWVDRNGASHTVTLSLGSKVEGAGFGDTYTATLSGVSPTGAWTGAATPATFDVVFDQVTGAVSTVNGAAQQTIDITIPDGTAGGQVVTLNLASLQNLDTPVALTQTSDGTEGGTQPSSSIFYDSLGVEHTLDLTFQKAVTQTAGAGGEWTYTASVDGTAIASTGRLVFNSDGTLDATNSVIGTIDFSPTNGAADVSITPNFTEVSQLATTVPNTVIARVQDGVAPGVLQSFSVDQDGTIQGTFSNGLGSQLGRLAVATFQNKEGLLRGMNGLLLESAASGTANIQPPAVTNGQGTPGIISSGALENSNVDIGDEFTNMIVAQRAFQANARMVNVVDQVLDELANLKR